jgi:DNA-binding transcriptional ArsR family regulator
MASDELSITFGALADPTRRAILARLAKGEATVMELAEPFELSLPGVSKHLKVLQHAGLITQGRKAQWRPCRLEPARLKDAADWVERYRKEYEERLSRLDELLQGLQQEKKIDKKEKR